MKSISLILLLVVTSLASCTKSNKIENPVCNEAGPPAEACLAYFTRWFYNKETNSCNEISYSGCAPGGFATKQECEACKCN